MIELEKVFRDSINEIKSKWNLPEKGFLAGGSICNIVWEKVSGNKAKINDLDIYILDKIIDNATHEELKEKQSFEQKEKIIYEDYKGLNYAYGTSRFYIIESVKSEGMLNTINYKASTDDPMLILNSFDINCCQLGYDIESDKFYWTKEFEDFLTTGKIQLVNLTSPSHSAIRLVKKKKDLGAKLEDVELDMIAHTLNNQHFVDIVKHRFKERYAKMFRDNWDDLKDKFIMLRDEDTENFLQQKYSCNDSIYRLKAKQGVDLLNSSQRLIGFGLSKDFIFWIRNIYNNPELEKTWFKLQHVFDTNMRVCEYLDCEITDEELDLIKRLSEVAPKSINNLKGKTLSKQLKIIHTLVDKFKHDPIVSISILEKINIDDNVDLNDDMTLLLLELSVRKEILQDPQDKVRRILDMTTEEYQHKFEQLNLPF
jgi:hypothetical protein